jgi:asparagine synthase (glutamine-hydrolysing)
VKAITGLEMPVFEKRRFQHGAVAANRLRTRIPRTESELRKQFLSLYQ